MSVTKSILEYQQTREYPEDLKEEYENAIIQNNYSIFVLSIIMYLGLVSEMLDFYMKAMRHTTNCTFIIKDNSRCEICKSFENNVI